MDARVLLSTFRGSGDLAGATISILNHQRVASHVTSNDAKVVVSARAKKHAPPAAPSFKATAVSTAQINLAWVRVAGATRYLVDELQHGVWTQVGNPGSGSTSYAVNGLSPGTTYSFDVGSSNAAGTTWASYQSATTLAFAGAP